MYAEAHSRLVYQMLVALVKELRLLPKYILTPPSSEYDLHNIIYLYLLRRYRVKYLGRRGRHNTIDFIIGDTIGLEVKYVKKNIDMDKALGQCIRYKNIFRLEWVILLLYAPGTKPSLKRYVPAVIKQGIAPLVIP